MWRNILVCRVSICISTVGYSFRRTAATLAAENGANDNQLMRLGRWHSLKTAKRYTDNTFKCKTSDANMILPPLVADGVPSARRGSTYCCLFFSLLLDEMVAIAMWNRMKLYQKMMKTFRWLVNLVRTHQVKFINIEL